MTSTGPYANVTERFVGIDSLGLLDRMLWLEGYQGRFYTYDKLSRLTAGRVQSATGTWPPGCPDADYGVKFCAMSLTWQQEGVADSITYDAVGNRTDKGGTYTTGNRVTNFDGCTYNTNAEGSDSTKTCGGVTTSFTWNAEGKLTAVTKTGGPTVAFYYDALGRVIRKDSAGTAKAYFLWDGDNLLAELGPAGTTKTAEYSYYPGRDNLHALVIGSTPYYAHSDPVGSVIALTDNSWTLQRSARYDDWGRADAFYSSDALPFNGKDRARWKGALWMGPEYDVYYMRNRWYEAGTGRFLSEDPVGLDGGINPTVYAGSNPISASDPDGTKVVCTSWVKYWTDTGQIISSWFSNCTESTDSWASGGSGGWGGTPLAKGPSCGPKLKRPYLKVEGLALQKLSKRTGVEMSGWVYSIPGDRYSVVFKGDWKGHTRTVSTIPGQGPFSTGFWGTIHTHPENGIGGLIGDQTFSLDHRTDFYKVVAAPDSIYLIDRGTMGADVIEACAYSDIR